MALTKLAPEMDIQQYVASLDLNPDNVFYQRVKSNNVSSGGAQWQITSPNKRSLLLAVCNVDWKLRFRQGSAAVPPVANPWISSADAISLKECMPLSNAMTSQTVSVNGNSITMSQPRRFCEPLSRMCVSKDESRSCFESGWWDGQGGVYEPTHPAHHASAKIDNGTEYNEQSLRSKMQVLDGVDKGGVLSLNLQADAPAVDAVISHQEPLLCPPFNPYGKVKNGLPEYLPWKHMSPVIPNIDRLEIDIQFNPTKLAAAIFHYRYANTGADTARRAIALNSGPSQLEAHLLCYWYEIPSTMNIPRSITIQTWNMREFQDTVGAVNNGAMIDITGNLLQLRSVPTFIVLHARRDQDAGTYQPICWTSDSNRDGNDATVAGGNDSLDNFMEIINLQVILGDRPNVISASFTSRELYQLTLKNSKIDGFSLSYADWLGRMCPRTVANVPAAAVVIQQSKCFVVLQPKDLAEKISPGVVFPTSLQFVLKLRARHGAFGQTGGNRTYRLFTHVFIGKHWLQIETDRAQFQEQNILLESALRASKPSLVSSSGQLADSAYTSRF